MPGQWIVLGLEPRGQSLPGGRGLDVGPAAALHRVARQLVETVPPVLLEYSAPPAFLEHPKAWGALSIRSAA